MARDAPPDKGLVIINGRRGVGICKKSKIGEHILDRKSLAPDAEKMLTLTIKAQSVGKSLQALIIPSFAPKIKDEK